MRWRCIVAYDGTGFFGWQSQRGGNTIQDHIERRLVEIFKRPVRIHGCSRTDSGVHAVGQVFHFDADWKYPGTQLLRALKKGIPRSIQVRSVGKAPPDFHARFSATGKRYSYRLHEKHALPMQQRYEWSLNGRRLDVAAMSQASGTLLGQHDFTAFSAVRGDASKVNRVKELRRLDVQKKGHRIKITTEASGYLYKMVRCLVGALVEVGLGVVPVEDIPLILKTAKRTKLIPAAPPQGLCLEKVFY